MLSYAALESRKILSCDDRYLLVERSRLVFRGLFVVTGTVVPVSLIKARVILEAHEIDGQTFGEDIDELAVELPILIPCPIVLCSLVPLLQLFQCRDKLEAVAYQDLALGRMHKAAKQQTLAASIQDNTLDSL